MLREQLPKDPMSSSSKVCNNYPLLAFSYLVRRFVLCPRFCLICYKYALSYSLSIHPLLTDSCRCSTDAAMKPSQHSSPSFATLRFASSNSSPSVSVLHSNTKSRQTLLPSTSLFNSLTSVQKKEPSKVTSYRKDSHSKYQRTSSKEVGSREIL